MLAAKREGRTAFVEDESTFSLKPYTTYGWYPTGPAVKIPLTNKPYERLYAFGVMDGETEHYRFFDGRSKKTINAQMALKFLRYLHARYPKLLLIWDKATYHRASSVRHYAESHDIQLLEFPTAVPEENPAEQAWDTLAVATANTYYENYSELLQALKNAARKKNLTKMYGYLNH